MKTAILGSILIVVSFFTSFILSSSDAGMIKGGKVQNLIFINGKIITMDRDLATAEALVVSNGKIIFVGEKERALQLKSADSMIVDLGGKLMLPGLTDAHAHFMGLGKILNEIDLRNTRTFDEVLGMVAKKKAKVAKGAWIIGRGWDQNRWKKKEFPDNAKLSELSSENPVYLKRIDGHAALANKKALEIANITRKTDSPAGGRIVRDSSGEATGILVDNAIELVEKRIPPLKDDEIKEAILKAQESCLKVGLTEVHDAGIDEATYKAYVELGREGKLKMRIYAMADLSGDFYKKALEMGPQISLFNGKLTMRTIKMYADGALGSRGALLSSPYSDDPKNSGLLLTPVEKMETVAEEATGKGFQVATHAIGDKANRIIIGVYEKVVKKMNPKGSRFRIEHVQVIQPTDIERMKRLGIIASMQPTHCTSDMSWVAERLGPERIGWGYSWRNILKAGVVLASGSDFPVESNDPLLGLYAAVTRQDKEGNPKDGFFPEQRLTLEEAVESFTSSAAYAAFEEHSHGRIKTGMDADLTVLDRDIFSLPAKDILRAKVVMTIVGGEIFKVN